MRSGDSCERALLQDGKQYGERRASSRAALDGDPAVVFLANPVHHREPQPLRVPVLLGGEEGLEDAWSDTWVDRLAGVRKPDHHELPVDVVISYRHMSARRHRAARDDDQPLE